MTLDLADRGLHTIDERKPPGAPGACGKAKGLTRKESRITLDALIRGSEDGLYIS